MMLADFRKLQRNVLGAIGGIMFFCVCFISVQAGVFTGLSAGTSGVIWILLIDKIPPWFGFGKSIFGKITEWQSEIGDFA